ncbi:MAG TPA: hypothetical protein VFS43_26850 [Polyangiaceae bacterium]|nr:hypothetical protein [Polyangiaceae bacterium]
MTRPPSPPPRRRPPAGPESPARARSPLPWRAALGRSPLPWRAAPGRSPLPWRAALALSLALAGACRPDFDRGPSLVEGARVLAVRSTPAEARPGEPVTFRALFVDPSGARADIFTEWAFCNERKPLTELGPVASACLVPSGPALAPFGSGASAGAALPAEGCRLFGPDPPEAKAGEPPGRPVDPDASGGYYQPLRLLYTVNGGEPRYALGGTRLVCGLAGVNQDTFAEFGRRYRPNENPALASLRALLPNGDALALSPEGEGEPARVAPGTRLRFVAAWPACPASDACGDAICGIDETAADCPADCTKPVGCGGAERYLALDPETRVLAERRETMRVTWFSPAGRFDDDATGEGGEAAGPDESSNGWVAPDAPASVPLWVVVRDDRGGVAFASYRVDVGG